MPKDGCHDTMVTAIVPMLGRLPEGIVPIDRARDVVTRILEVLREPDEVMLAEGEDSKVGDRYAGRHGARAVWTCMVDALISEGAS